MVITMLYFDTIASLIEEHGFTWDHLEKIKDHEHRVLFTYEYEGEERSYSTSLRMAFRDLHFDRSFDKHGTEETVLIKAFVKALVEVA